MRIDLEALTKLVEDGRMPDDLLDEIEKAVTDIVARRVDDIYAKDWGKEGNGWETEPTETLRDAVDWRRRMRRREDGQGHDDEPTFCEIHACSGVVCFVTWVAYPAGDGSSTYLREEVCAEHAIVRRIAARRHGGDWQIGMMAAQDVAAAITNKARKVWEQKVLGADVNDER